MKIQDLLPQFLYQQKTLSLPGLGTFELDSTINVYELKEVGWPENTITFKLNRNAPITDEFLTYLVLHTGKMKSLALSDLESYLGNGVELLNIGKPFPLKGIGSITKTTQGNLVFQQGTPALEKIDSINTDHVKDRTAEQDAINEIDFSSLPAKSSRKVILVFGVLLALALIGWLVYLVIPKNKTTNESQTVAADTVAVAQTNDSTSTSNTNPGTATAVDTAFTLLLERFTNKASAHKKLETLKERGHNVVLEMKDSTHYNLLLQVNRPLADTTYVRDSLKKWYLWKTELIKPGQ